MYKKRSRVRAVDGKESGASPVGSSSSGQLGLFFISDTSLLSDMPCQPESERERHCSGGSASEMGLIKEWPALLDA
jgi:hypothetical protein